MNSRRLIALVFLLVLAVFVSGGTVLANGPTVKYVDQVNGDDANDGSSAATAYATLQKAIDTSESGLSQADRSYIYVMDGIYSGNGQSSCEGFSASIVVKDLDFLTIQAADGHNPVIRPDTAVESNIVSLSVEDSDYLAVDNIDSDQTVAQFDNWVICESDHLTVRNSRFEGGEDGIDFASGLVGALIENNEFVDVNTGSGDEVLDFTDGSYADVVIQDNLFLDNYRQITVNPLGTATNFTIRRNVMNGTVSQEAVRLINADGVTLENNVIMNSAQQGLYIDDGSSNVTVWHNSFFNNGFEEVRTKVSTPDIVILNNILYANGTFAAIGAAASPLPGEDFNLVFNAGSDTESGSQPPVTNFGANTITGQDPLFASSTPGSEDLHLQEGSPALEAGTGAGVGDDVEQNVRPNPAGTNPDIGAYEMPSPDDEGPITSNVQASPNPIAVSADGTVTANVDDSTTGGSDIASAEYSLDGAAGMPMDASDGSFDEAIEDVNATFTAPDEAGIYDLCVRGTDAPGNTGAEECAMLVVYDPDGGFVTGGGWIESPEGAYMPPPGGTTVVSAADVGVSWFSPDNRADGYVDFVEGPESPPLGTGSLEMGSAAGADKAQLFNYDHVGTLLADIDGLSYATYRHSSSTNAAQQYPAINMEVDFVGDGSSFTTLVWEPLYAYGQSNLAVDTWQSWDTMAASQTAFGGGWWSTRVIPGVCAFNCFVNWDTIIVNNPDAVISGGFGVNIGSGWNGVFTGSVDALSLTVDGIDTTYDFEATAPFDPTGKANFGFVAKYKKGANVPDGNTEFVFKAADLNFHSTSYDWLVVTGNDSANFKGEGTINGANVPDGNPYKFKIWAHDGSPDTFRIKIWWEDGNSEVVVYDNGANQPIGGGNIVVHKK